jgi:hypothetical protein
MTSTKTRSSSLVETPDDEKIKVSPLDILCGRGIRCTQHLGNRRFRAMIALSLDNYSVADTRQAKTKVVRKVMYDITSVGTRFIRIDHRTGACSIIENVKVICDKIGHALRDSYPLEAIVGAKEFMKAHGFKYNGKAVVVDSIFTGNSRPDHPLAADTTTAKSRFYFNNLDSKSITPQEENLNLGYRRKTSMQHHTPLSPIQYLGRISVPLEGKPAYSAKPWPVNPKKEKVKEGIIKNEYPPTTSNQQLATSAWNSSKKSGPVRPIMMPPTEFDSGVWLPDDDITRNPSTQNGSERVDRLIEPIKIAHGMQGTQQSAMQEPEEDSDETFMDSINSLPLLHSNTEEYEYYDLSQLLLQGL